MKSQKFRGQDFGCSMKRDEMTTKTLVSDFIAQTLISTSEIRLGGWGLVPDPDRGVPNSDIRPLGIFHRASVLSVWGVQTATFGLVEFFIEQAV